MPKVPDQTKIRTPIFMSKTLHSQNPKDGCQSLYFLLSHGISAPLSNPVATAPFPTPATPSISASLQPLAARPSRARRGSPLHLGRWGRPPAWRGDPDHLPGGGEALVTPRPEPANPLAAGGMRIEQAVGEQRDQSGGGMLGVFLWTGRLVSIRGSKRLPWVSILRIIHHL